MHADQNATNLSTEERRGQRSKTKFTHRIRMSFMNLNDESGRYKIVSVNRNHVTVYVPKQNDKS